MDFQDRAIRALSDLPLVEHPPSDFGESGWSLIHERNSVAVSASASVIRSRICLTFAGAAPPRVSPIFLSSFAVGHVECQTVLRKVHDALDHKILAGPVTAAESMTLPIEGAVHRLPPKLMTVFPVLASLCRSAGIGSGLACNETECGADCGRHDHLHRSRIEPRLGVFCADEESLITPWHSA